MSIITAKVETITPEMAKQLLEVNEHNRKVSTVNVVKIENALKAGEWMVSGQTIVISETGQLLDGQHRVHAVLNTGISMDHLVCRGISDDAFKVIDTGKSRSGGDALSIIGSARGNKISNLIKMIDAYDNKHMTVLSKLSNTEIVMRYNSNPSFYDNLLDEGIDLLRSGHTRIFGDYTLALLYHVFSQHIDGLDYLTNVLNAEIKAPKDNPTDIERIKFTLMRIGKQGHSRGMQEQKYFALFFGFVQQTKGLNLPDRFDTFTLKEAKQVSKPIPYL